MADPDTDSEALKRYEASIAIFGRVRVENEATIVELKEKLSQKIEREVSDLLKNVACLQDNLKDAEKQVAVLQAALFREDERQHSILRERNEARGRIEAALALLNVSLYYDAIRALGGLG